MSALLNDIIEQFLYGAPSTPADKTLDSLVRPAGATTSFDIQLDGFMTNGAGRLATGSKFQVIEKFFEGGPFGYTNSVPADVYSLSSIIAALGLSQTSTVWNMQHLKYLGGDDWFERTLLFNTQQYIIDDTVSQTGPQALRFVVEADGTRRIENLSIRPSPSATDDFNFVGGSSETNTLNAAIRPFLDPGGIGRTVNFNYVGTAPREEYTLTDYLLDSVTDVITSIGSRQLVNRLLLGPQFPLVAQDLWNQGITKFLGPEDRPILYGTELNNALSEADIDSIYNLSNTYVRLGVNTIDDLLEFRDNGVVLVAGSGNDTLVGGVHDDLLRGGAGTDIATYTGDCLEYNLSRNAQNEIVVTHARPSGTSSGSDTLRGVEQIRFGDGKTIDLSLPQIVGCTSIGFVEDFVTGTITDTQVVFNISRLGDTSYPIRVFVDGRVTQSTATFNDFFYTIPAGDNPQLILGASVASVLGDVAFDFVISIQVADPLFPFVEIADATAGGVLIGEGVDDRGGRTWGDPHLISFDNVAFDFQAAGEFVLVRAASGAAYEVQARFVALSSAVSVTQAAATKIGDVVVSIEADGAEGTVRIDGSVATLSDGQTLPVGGGSVSRAGDTIEIDHGNGDLTVIEVFGSFLNVSPQPSLTRAAGSLEGLLGNANGTPADDFRLSDGTVLTTPVPIATLYGAFAASWTVAANDRLLPGLPEAYDAPDRIITVDSLPDSIREAAEAAVDAAGITNPILREAAILDFALTGNSDFIEAARLTDAAFDPIVGTTPVDPVNSPVIVLTTDAAELNEDDGAARTATLTVARGTSEGDVLVAYVITGAGAAPATAGDFVDRMVTGEVLLRDGEESATFTVEVADDRFAEGTELFDVTIALSDADASSYELLIESVRIQITDEDQAVRRNKIIGTSDNDDLVGTIGEDVIRGQKGNDTVAGDNDTLAGGDGADLLRGNSGDDILEGGDGNDTIYGGGGFDVVRFALARGDVEIDEQDDGSFIIRDISPAGLGIDVIYLAERLDFTDTSVSLI